MIKSLSGGSHIQVTGASGFAPYVNMSNPSAGMVRYNGNSQNLEIYDGSSWMAMYSSAANVSMDYEVQTILNWAKQKMQEDQRLKELAEKHPGIEDLRQKLAVMVALVQQQEKQV